jgi:hypothetical protein
MLSILLLASSCDGGGGAAAAASQNNRSALVDDRAWSKVSTVHPSARHAELMFIALVFNERRQKSIVKSERRQNNVDLEFPLKSNCSKLYVRIDVG